jgi:hypothetical protein
MPRAYSVNGSAAVASPTKTTLTVVSTTTIRPSIYDIIMGFTATPADNALEWLYQRFTAAGTVTAVTPQALDPGNPAASATAGKNATAEPTYTSAAVLLDVPMNQRSTQRWVCAPDGELIIPATGANGIGAQPVHASFTGTATCMMHFRE